MPQDTVRVMRTRGLLILALVAVLGLAACGDDGDSASTDDPTIQSTAASEDQVVLEADLVGGAAEVPDPGDPDGTGAATVKIDAAKGEVCYTITVASIEPPVASHIHEGAQGGAGPVLITFDHTKIGQGEDCLTGQETADLERIVAKPDGFYVNVHTADYKGGAVRGQLSEG